jgi:acetoin utilization deacetylase AcuC-like enzyme
VRVHFHPAFRDRPRLAWFPGSLREAVTVQEPEEPTRDLVLQVHSTSLVERIERSRLRDLGFLSVGAVVGATRTVAETGGRAVALPGVGGHHAGKAFYGGMCLLNDVAVALADLRRDRPWRVAILDTDAHHADGSLEVLGPDPETLYFCVCTEGFPPPYPETFDLRVSPGLEADTYLETVLASFASRARQFRPELVIWYFGFDLLEGEYASLGFETDFLRRLGEGVASLADELAEGRLVAVLGGGKDPDRAEQALCAVIEGLSSEQPARVPAALPASVEAADGWQAPKRVSKEWVEMTFGPLGAGEQEVQVGSERLTARGVLEQLGLSYEDIDPIDLVTVEADRRWVVRFFDAEDRRVVVVEFGPEFSIASETRVHVKEWMGADYYDFPWSVGCPWSLA